MFFDSFPREAREDLDEIRFDTKKEVDEKSRRRCTTFGYSRGGEFAMVMWMCMTVSGAFFAGIVLIILTPSIESFMSVSWLFWLIVLVPLGVIPVLPFLFLKLRYALKATGIVVALCATTAVVMTALSG